MSAAVTVIDGARFPRSKDHAAELKLKQRLNQRRARAAELRQNYYYWLKKGVGWKINEAAQLCTHSFSFKLSSAIEQNRRLPFKRRIGLVDLADAASALDLSSPCDEIVRLHPEYKVHKPNEFRSICAFGPRHRTAQTAALILLSQGLKRQPFQFDKRGTAEAIRAAAKAFRSGQLHYVHLDIKNFFGSFDAKALREALPLPVQVADNYLVGRKLKFGCWGCDPSLFPLLQSQARAGVMPGSSTSPVIGALTISKLDFQPPPSILVVNYVDDFLIVGASAADVLVTAKALVAAAAALPTGHFKLEEKSAGKITDGLVFLGVHMQLVGDTLTIKPAPGRVEAFQEQFTKRLSVVEALIATACSTGKKGDEAAALQELAEVWSFARGWAEAYSVCDAPVTYFDIAFSPTMKLLSGLGKSSLKSLDPYLPGWKKANDYPF